MYMMMIFQMTDPRDTSDRPVQGYCRSIRKVCFIRVAGRQIVKFCSFPIQPFFDKSHKTLVRGRLFCQVSSMWHES